MHTFKSPANTIININYLTIPSGEFDGWGSNLFFPCHIFLDQFLDFHLFLLPPLSLWGSNISLSLRTALPFVPLPVYIPPPTLIFPPLPPIPLSLLIPPANTLYFKSFSFYRLLSFKPLSPPFLWQPLGCHRLLPSCFLAFLFFSLHLSTPHISPSLPPPLSP